MYRALRILLVASLAACATDELPFEQSDIITFAKPGDTKPGKGGGRPTKPDTTTPPDTTPPPPPPPDTTTPPDTTPPPPAGGGSAWKGEVLFAESFDDGSLAGRGWYDVDQPRISTAEHAPGSTASFECSFAAGAHECAGGVPGRRQFADETSLHFSYWVKYADGWVGSGRAYHPHEFHFLTNQDDRWVGPSYTRLTLYVEQVGGRPRVALQDGANVDPDCILRNDGSVLGCNGGSIANYPFGENRSVAACNGLIGPVDGRDCYSLGGGLWYSMRWWAGSSPVLAGGTGWHFVETYVQLNSVVNGVGQADGEIRQWVDGNPTVVAEGVLLRTGQHPSMLFDQILFAPYIGDGSPIAQTVFYDEVTVARGRRP